MKLLLVQGRQVQWLFQLTAGLYGFPFGLRRRCGFHFLPFFVRLLSYAPSETAFFQAR